MSAYVVTPEHIIELVAFAVSKGSYGANYKVDPRYLKLSMFSATAAEIASGIGSLELAKTYAAILYEENCKSVFNRYPDCQEVEDLPGLVEKPEFIQIREHHITNRKVTNPVHILKMCNCLVYQSCETDTWGESDAYKLLGAIKDAAIYCLPGYDDAPWEYTREG